jgi:hypothetical protein
MERTDLNDSPFALARPSAKVGVYRIVGPDRVYIGSSDDIPRRWKSHLSQLRGRCHHNYRLQAAWNEYGEAACAFTVVEEVAHVAGSAGRRAAPALDVSTPARGLVEVRGHPVAGLADPSRPDLDPHRDPGDGGHDDGQPASVAEQGPKPPGLPVTSLPG